MTKEYKLPKRIEIDRSKWICESPSPDRCDLGTIALRNTKGYRCCLGFACEAAGLPRESLIGNSNPYSTNSVIEGLTIPVPGTAAVMDTLLAAKAIIINDDPEKTQPTKEKELRELFKSFGYQLVFKGSYSEKQREVMSVTTRIHKKLLKAMQFLTGQSQ